MAARARSRFDQDDYRPQNDVYTGLLAISLVAMLVSCVLLFLDYNQYAGKAIPPIPPIPSVKTVQTGMISLPPPPEIPGRPTVQSAPATASSVQPVNGLEQQGGSPVVPAHGENP